MDIRTQTGRRKSNFIKRRPHRYFVEAKNPDTALLNNGEMRICGLDRKDGSFVVGAEHWKNQSKYQWLKIEDYDFYDRP